jgi:hypothetical protein
VKFYIGGFLLKFVDQTLFSLKSDDIYNNIK